ncbi:MAG: hypothetical protein LUQ25_01900 [Methanoregulaceae archaeon]|nr:hypothetical protein [Methanoregulaceae archaeon]
MTFSNDTFQKIGELLRTLIDEAGTEGTDMPVSVNIVMINMPKEQGNAGCRIADNPIEPEIEIQKVGDEVKIVTGLPGISADRIIFSLDGPHLSIRGEENGLRYHASASVPVPEKDSVRISFRNGVFEISYRELPPDRNELLQ